MSNTEKRAPVQGYPGGIPWAIHLEAYEVYCKRWGAQPALIDLEGRNCRGGFSTGELDDFIPGWRDRVAEFGLMKTELAQLRARADDYAVEINRLRNVVQAACTGGLGHMIERWKVLFPDAPVPSVNVPTEPMYLVHAGGDAYQAEIVPESKLDDAYLLTQWCSLDSISAEERADALAHFHDDDAWTHTEVTGKGDRLKFSLALEDGWIEVVRLPSV